MKLQPWIAAVVVTMGVASCAPDAPPATQTRSGLSSTGANGQTASSGQSGKNKVAREDVPVPPVDAQWTILCESVDGPAHVQDAAPLKSRLMQASGMPDWYIIHGDKESTLYYGYYRSFDNATEKTRAEQDRQAVATLTDRLGNRLLRGGVFVAVNAPDPVSPPEWNLLNTPKNAYWTMEIATFSGNPKRKEAAVQAVRELREKGEPAYYYHGPSSSSVCIGAWPRDAVAEQGTGVTSKTGNTRDDAHTVDPTQSLLVFGGIDPAPPNVAGRVLEPDTGKPLTVEGMKLEIQSPDMKKWIAIHPDHYVNYELHGSQNGNQSFADPSVLVIIPRDEPAGGDDYLLNGGTPRDMVTTPARPHAPTAAGDNVLRSIGDK